MAALRNSILATALCALGEAADLEAQSLIRQGIEFHVNSFTVDMQSNPGAAIGAGGAFVIAWASKEQDGSAYGVFAQRFDSAGDALAAEFQVSSFTSENQNYPVVGIAGDGGFVVVWQSAFQDGSGEGIFARLFDAGGTPLAIEFQISSRTSDAQSNPVLGMQSDGDFVVAWDTWHLMYPVGAFARRFSSDGSPVGAEFQVSSYTGDAEFGAAIAINDDGDFVVAWMGEHDGDDTGVFARRFDGAGPVGLEFQINSSTLGKQLSPAVDIDEQGAFVVTWANIQTGGSDGTFARRFDSGGAPIGAEFEVDNATAGIQFPEVVLSDGGEFVIAWRDSQQDGDSYGFFARAFDAAGGRIGVELQLNTHTMGAQGELAMVAGGSGDIVVAWASDDQDGSGRGIFAQRLAEPAVLDVDADGSVEPLSDGLLILRFLFGFTGSTLTGGAVAVDCSRCDAAAIESYLDGLI